jgi:hypothetical protein
MGEIADSMINGEFDFYTGEYLGKPVGYPRTFNGSLPWERRGPKFLHPPKPAFGVLNYMEMKGITRQDHKEAALKAYAEKKKWDVPEGRKFIRKVSALISVNFGDFKSWLGNYIKNGYK